MVKVLAHELHIDEEEQKGAHYVQLEEEVRVDQVGDADHGHEPIGRVGVDQVALELRGILSLVQRLEVPVELVLLCRT